MIKADKGEVEIVGNGIDVLSDFACLVSVMVKNGLPIRLLTEMFEKGCDIGYAQKNKGFADKPKSKKGRI